MELEAGLPHIQMKFKRLTVNKAIRLKYVLDRRNLVRSIIERRGYILTFWTYPEMVTNFNLMREVYLNSMTTGQNVSGIEASTL